MNMALARTDIIARQNETTRNGATPALRIRDVSLHYGAFRAVKAVNLDVQTRAVTAIIGPSGCGKSTLLRTINRINDRVPGFRVEGSIKLRELDVYAPTT